MTQEKPMSPEAITPDKTYSYETVKGLVEWRDSRIKELEAENKALALEVAGLRKQIEDYLYSLREQHDCFTIAALKKILATPSTLAKQVEARIRAEQRERDISLFPKKQKYDGIHDNFITGFNNSLDQAERAIREDAIRNQGESHE